MFKKLMIACGIAILALTSCSDEQSTAPAVEETATTGDITLNIVTEKVGILAKTMATEAIEFEKVVFTFTAFGTDSIVEEVAASGSQIYYTGQTFTLPALKEWTVKVETIDTEGVAIHTGSATFYLEAGETKNLQINVDPSYSILKANFGPLPESITKLEIVVGGEVVASEAFTANSMTGETVTIDFNHLPVTVGSYVDITLNAYGIENDIEALLYSGTTELEVVATQDSFHSIELKWVGMFTAPSGVAVLNVNFGYIATVSFNASFQNATDVDWNTTQIATCEGWAVASRYCNDGIFTWNYYSPGGTGHVFSSYSATTGNVSTADFTAPYARFLIDGDKVAFVNNSNTLPDTLQYFNGTSVSTIASENEIVLVGFSNGILTFNVDGKTEDFIYQYDGSSITQIASSLYGYEATAVNESNKLITINYGNPGGFGTILKDLLNNTSVRLDSLSKTFNKPLGFFNDYVIYIHNNALFATNMERTIQITDGAVSAVTITESEVIFIEEELTCNQVKSWNITELKTIDDNSRQKTLRSARTSTCGLVYYTLDSSVYNYYVATNGKSTPLIQTKAVLSFPDDFMSDDNIVFTDYNGAGVVRQVFMYNTTTASLLQLTNSTEVTPGTTYGGRSNHVLGIDGNDIYYVNYVDMLIYKKTFE